MNDSLANRILSLLSLEVQVIQGSRGIRDDLTVRGNDSDFQNPQGWSVHSEVITQSAFFEFKFDSQAKPLQDFYIERVREIRNYWESSVYELENLGMKITCTLDGNQQEFREITSVKELQTLGIKARVDVVDETLELIPIERLESFLISFISFVLLPLIPDELENSVLDSVESGMPEGAVAKVEVNKYERSPRNRAACLAHFGNTCQGCGFSFAEKYGEIASGYIHVHHLVPISMVGANYIINPLTDLIPLCPNCHAAIHLQSPPFSLIELRTMTGFTTGIHGS
jgi:5-methylcytosine-specific restriction protein A